MHIKHTLNNKSKCLKTQSPFLLLPYPRILAPHSSLTVVDDAPPPLCNVVVSPALVTTLTRRPEFLGHHRNVLNLSGSPHLIGLAEKATHG